LPRVADPRRHSERGLRQAPLQAPSRRRDRAVGPGPCLRPFRPRSQVAPEAWREPEARCARNLRGPTRCHGPSGLRGRNARRRGRRRPIRPPLGGDVRQILVAPQDERLPARLRTRRADADPVLLAFSGGRRYWPRLGHGRWRRSRARGNGYELPQNGGRRHEDPGRLRRSSLVLRLQGGRRRHPAHQDHEQGEVHDRRYQKALALVETLHAPIHLTRAPRRSS